MSSDCTLLRVVRRALRRGYLYRVEIGDTLTSTLQSCKYVAIADWK